MSNLPPPLNPYSYTVPSPEATYLQPNRYPTQIIVAATIDLFYLALRLVLVGLGAIGLAAMGTDDPLFIFGILEILTGGLMVLFGIPAGILLIIKHRRGVLLGWLCLIATLLNLVVALAEIPIQLGNAQARMAGQNPTAVYIGALVGGGFVLLLRLAWNGFYAYALVEAKKALSS